MHPVIARAGRDAGCGVVVAERIEQDGNAAEVEARLAARADRRARQARVGILRNPNRKPLPPPRRPPLMGRQLSLRSSRRPPKPGPADAPGPEPTADSALVLGADGQIARIDVDRLAALADRLGDWRPRRAKFGAGIIADDPAPDAAPPAPASGASALEPEAALRDDPFGPGGPEPEPGPGSGPGGLWRRLLGRLRRASAPETG